MFKNVATSIALFAFDTTTGAAKTGDASNITAYVSKDYGTVTVLGDTSATEMDATNAKGWYLFDVAQAESNADALLFTAKSTTSNTSVVGQYIFTAPNRFTSLVIDAAGIADANAVKIGPTGAGTAQTARDVGASVLLSAGTGTGQLDFTSGVVKANLAQILGTALTETAGQIAAAFKKFFNIATPASTMDALTLVATATNLTNAPTSGDLTATMKASVTTAATAATPIAASVTGNVGGNVAGSTGSVASGGITASSFGAGAINAASIAADTGLQSIRSNTATAGAASSITLDAGASATNSFYNGAWIVISGGTGAGQVRAITAYVGATKVATTAPAWITNPASGSTFVIVPAANVTGVQGAVTGSVASVTGSVGSVTGAVGSVTGAVGSVTGLTASNVGAIKAKTDNLPASPAATGDAMTLTVAYDAAKTASQLDAAGVRTAVGMASANLDTQIAAIPTATAPTAAANASAVWNEGLAGHATAGSSGAALAAAGAAGDPWATAIPGAYGSGTAGKIIGTNLDAAVSSRSTYAAADTAGTTTLLARLTATRAGLLDNVDAAVSTRLATSGYTAPPSAAANASAVWDEALSGHTTAGSAGAELAAAGSAGDPWATALPGSYGGGTAGKIVGDSLDAAVSTRLSSGSYTAPDNADIALIKAKTDNLPAAPADESLIIAATSSLATLIGTPVVDVSTDIAAVKAAADAIKVKADHLPDADLVNTTGKLWVLDGDGNAIAPASATTAIEAKTDLIPASPAAVSDIPTAAENADALLGRSISGGADGGRIVTDALRALRNKTSIAGGTLTVTAEDDATTAWTAAVTTAPGDPLASIDPT